MKSARKRKRRRVLLAVLATLLLLSGAAYVAVGAAAAKPDITVQISPASQSVEAGKTTTYTVTLTSTGGFEGTVALSASGNPSGSTASLLPGAPNLTPSGTGSTATSVLSVTTTAGTPVGSYTLKVTGTGGKVSRSITTGLMVNPPLSGALSMTPTPASVTMAPGSVAAYAVQLVRTNVSGDVTLSVTGLPTGATPAFAPSPITGNSSTLLVTTTDNTPDGAYTLYLVASGNDANNETRYAYASVQLVIKTTGRSFAISGNLEGLLAPGRTLPLQLSLTNPNKKSLSVTNLSVTLQSVTRTKSAIGHGQPCTIGDYAVSQYSGGYPLVMPGSTTMNLTQLGVSSRQRPQIQFVNTLENQDGCKGATLSLSYSGSGQGN